MVRDPRQVCLALSFGSFYITQIMQLRITSSLTLIGSTLRDNLKPNIDWPNVTFGLLCEFDPCYMDLGGVSSQLSYPKYEHVRSRRLIL